MDAEMWSQVRESLERRGWANAGYWVNILMKDRGLEEASQMFTLILADVLEEARVAQHNKQIMEACWQNLKRQR
jgi:hypothetical protein